MFRLSTIGLALIYFIPPIIGIIGNRLDPNAGTALGVPFLAMIGLIAGMVATLIFGLLGRRWSVWKPSLPAAGTVLVMSAALVLIADRGWLSVVQ